ncbi:MAG: glycerate kinase, partial [Actinomycetes bacterium]
SVDVVGPMGRSAGQIGAEILRIGEVAYVESAQACGLHLVPPKHRDPTLTTSYGVGELIAAAVSGGASTIVVGLGGSGTNDAGSGMLAALGASADARLDAGGLALAQVTTCDLSRAREAVAAVTLVAATDVDSPLLGLTGATNVFAAQKGADDHQIMKLEGALESFARVLGRRASDGKDPAVALGAGAAGGLGYALLQLGATRAAGIGTVMAAVGFSQRVADADLVVTGEGRFDWTSLRGKVVSGVAAQALAGVRPCVVIAGEVVVGRREYSTIGVSGAYSVSEIVGSLDYSMHHPAQSVQRTAERVAQTWSR